MLSCQLDTLDSSFVFSSHSELGSAGHCCACRALVLRDLLSICATEAVCYLSLWRRVWLRVSCQVQDLRYCYCLTSILTADPNDWVNVNYVVSSKSSATTSAQNAIVSKADSTAQQGPWSRCLTAPVNVYSPSVSYHQQERQATKWRRSRLPQLGTLVSPSNGLSSPGSTLRLAQCC